MAVLSTLLRITNFRNPFLRTLVPSVAGAFAIQTAVAIPSIYYQSERFYDLSGSLTYLSVTALSLYLPTLRARAAAALAGSVKPAYPSLRAAFNGTASPNGLNWRQVVLSAAVSLWAVRLGSFLFDRVLRDGHDSRFDEIKKQPPKFLAAFLAQATWVSVCLLPILALNSVPHAILSTVPTLKVTDLLGLSLYAGGIVFEAVADAQKSRWSAEKRRKEHDEQFLTRGLWSKSRHPNYFGETTLWSGMATVAAGVLTSAAGLKGMGVKAGVPGTLLGLSICAISPAFVTFLLLKVSGVPMSEEKYDKKFGERKDYQEWKKNTPMFIPRF